MGYELLVLVVKFGLNSEVLEFLVKNECDDENLMIWCYELMFWFILMLPWSMLTIGEVCTTILGQMGAKVGFWGDFWVSSR